MTLKSCFIPYLNTTVKMGRIKPRLSPLCLNIDNYLLRSLPPAPDTIDWGAKVSSWPMYVNNQLGDCVIAGGAHEVGCWTANETGTTALFTDQQIISLYSIIGGYKPGDPSTDQGCVITDMLRYLQNPGFPGKHTIAGYVSVNNANRSSAQDACWLLGTITLGAALPDLWVKNPQPGFVWDADTPNPDNGHCVCVVGYDSTGVQIITWGMKGTITWKAFEDRTIIDEAYAKVSNDWVNKTKLAPSGFSLEQLLLDMKSLAA